MSERVQSWRWRRYQRGLRTIPLIVISTIAIWAMAGGGYFWPKWVLLWAGLTMAVRARRAMRELPPDEEDAVLPLASPVAAWNWPPTRSAPHRNEFLG